MSLKESIADIEKTFGKGSLIKLGDSPLDFPVYPTGIRHIDKILGGGLPQGRIVELFGPEGSGKSTLALHAVAETQRNGGVCAYIDAEHALDPSYARMIGVDVDELLFSQPSNGEEGLQIVEKLVNSKEVSLIVVDSVAALTPRAELAGDIGDSHVGLQARMMSQGLRILTGKLNTTHTTCIFINQLREKIGVMFGSPETTPGGRALKFYSSQRIDVRRKEALKDGSEVTGAVTKVKTVKNKINPPFKEVNINLVYGLGFDKDNMLLDDAVNQGLLVLKGAWYNRVDLETGELVQIAQGRKNTLEVFRTDEEFHDYVVDNIDTGVLKS